MSTPEIRQPVPPFTRETAIQKVRLAEDGWNSRDAAKVALAYTPDTKWRNRAEFASSRAEAEAFLTRKWNKELEYRLIKELWAFTDNRIAVRYAYECEPLHPSSLFIGPTKTSTPSYWTVHFLLPAAMAMEAGHSAPAPQ